MTVHDVWERCFPIGQTSNEDEPEGHRKEASSDDAAFENGDMYHLFGFQTTRLATAPFLDTVEEESEGEMEAEVQQSKATAEDEVVGQPQASSGSLWSSRDETVDVTGCEREDLVRASDSMDSSSGIEGAAPPSREVLLLLREEEASSSNAAARRARDDVPA